MSQSHDQQPALGSRENFFGDDDYDADGATGHDSQPFDYKRAKAEHAAYAFLKPLVRKVDPEQLLAEPDPYLEADYEERALAETLGVRPDCALHSEQRAVDVTDPALRLAQRAAIVGDRAAEFADEGQPTETGFGQQRYRHRYNEETGVATGPYFESMDTESFVDAVKTIVPYWQAELGLSEQQAAELKRDARRLKQAGDRTDLEILSQLMTDLVEEYSQQFRGLQQVREAKRIAGD